MGTELKYDKTVVLERLKKNLKQHRKDADKARKGYEAKLAEAFKRRLKQLEDGKKVDPIDQDFIRRYPVPTHYIDEYEAIIDQLETTTDSVIVLTAEQFSSWMRDKWAWQTAFTASNSRYF